MRLRQGIIVNTDGWKGYRKIHWRENGLVQSEHIHGKEGSMRRDFRHSNRVEGLWGQIKTAIISTYVSIPGVKEWLDFVFEAAYRARLHEKCVEEQKFLVGQAILDMLGFARAK